MNFTLSANETRLSPRFAQSIASRARATAAGRIANPCASIVEMEFRYDCRSLAKSK
jgi:hypothetical protein